MCVHTHADKHTHSYKHTHAYMCEHTPKHAYTYTVCMQIHTHPQMVGLGYFLNFSLQIMLQYSSFTMGSPYSQRTHPEALSGCLKAQVA